MKTLEEARREFSFLEDHIYLDTATTGLAWDGQAEAAGGFYTDAKRMGYVGSNVWNGKEQAVRKRLAKLLHAVPEEIYFYSSTTEFVNLIAHSLTLSPGDQILMAEGEYPAITAPWEFLRERGVEIVRRSVSSEETRQQDLLRGLTERTRLVLLSHVQYTTGTKADLAAVGKDCHEAGAFVLVDGTQGLGAVPVNLEDVDFYVSSTFKWILGAFGLSVAVVKKEAEKQLRPAYAGYGGNKLQYTSVNYPTLWALDAALDLFEEVGWTRIYDQVAQVTDFLMDGLKDLGISVLTPRNAREGIVSFRHPRGGQIERAMAQRKIYFAYRDGYVRIAPHFYNTVEDVRTMLNALRECLTMSEGK